MPLALHWPHYEPPNSQEKKTQGNKHERPKSSGHPPPRTQDHRRRLARRRTHRRPRREAATTTKPTLHRYDNYAWLRGFSVVPSWGVRIEEAWWYYDGGRMREEAALARQVHANCIRLWIEFSAWMANPDKVTASFLDAVKAIGEAGMKTMPCLFNRWHDYQWDYGGTYTETLFRDWKPQLDYVRALVPPLAADDNVLIWDLCNEPQAFDVNSDVNKKEFAWLKLIAETVRACSARQPLTIGTMDGRTSRRSRLSWTCCAHTRTRTPAANC